MDKRLAFGGHNIYDRGVWGRRSISVSCFISFIKNRIVITVSYAYVDA